MSTINAQFAERANQILSRFDGCDLIIKFIVEENPEILEEAAKRDDVFKKIYEASQEPNSQLMSCKLLKIAISFYD